ncbi:MAG: hypothetical protein AAF632_24915 [Bacteroidota bacterium]
MQYLTTIIRSSLLSKVCAVFLIVLFAEVQAQKEPSDTVLFSNNGFYYRTPPLSVNHLNVGDILAAPYLPKSNVVSAKLTDGKLPEGLSLFPNGLIVVSQQDIVQVGDYPLTIVTQDQQENQTTTKLTLEIIAANDRLDQEAIYKLESQPIIGALSEGEVLARPIDQDGTIKMAKCIMGGLPPGTQLTPDGKIVVSDHKLLVPNTYNAGIVTIDQLGGVTFFMVTVPLEAPKDVRQ